MSNLISRNLTRIYGYAFGRLYNKDDVDELTSEIVYEIITSSKRLKSDAAFWAFAWKIAKNTFRKFIRRKELAKKLEPLPKDDDNRLMWAALNMIMVNGYDIANTKSPIGNAPKLPLGSCGLLFGHDNDYVMHHFAVSVWKYGTNLKPHGFRQKIMPLSIVASCLFIRSLI